MESEAKNSESQNQNRKHSRNFYNTGRDQFHFQAFVLDAHPFWSEIIFSAGHDGNLIVWNVMDGTIIAKYFNKIDNAGKQIKSYMFIQKIFPGYGSLFDLAISPDGTLVATVDSHGNLSILGLGRNDAAKMQPNEQFFHTDYRLEEQH